MTPDLGTRAPADSLVRRAVQAVTGHIRSRGLRVGDTLPGEGWFAAELGVSRAVMREAFGALTALRLIDVGNGRKPRVGAIDGSVMAASLGHGVDTAQITVPEVWDVRRTIEARTVALAAERRSGEEAERIAALAAAMARDVDDLQAVTRHDVAFHQAIAQAGRNALFVQIVASFAPLMAVAVPAAWNTRHARAERGVMIERHMAVAEAIRLGEPSAAVKAMDAHFDTSIGDVLQAMDEAGTQHEH